MSGFLNEAIRRYPPDDPHLEDLARWVFPDEVEVEPVYMVAPPPGRPKPAVED